ncbi:hypothetical protein [Pseudolysinimonas sp.]|uniref:hypothetical protein n=1 Tax=Pseudolysinimonas sp. TaxID=2680009 RepID=UPI00286BC160|nr:hypothetical protein [Pseudolysinimonas sp.]
MLHTLWASTPPPGEELDPNLVTPGVVGFALTFALAVVVVLLVIDMVRRIRRINHRAAVNERLDAEEAAADDDKD